MPASQLASRAHWKPQSGSRDTPASHLANRAHALQKHPAPASQHARSTLAGRCLISRLACSAPGVTPTPPKKPQPADDDAAVQAEKAQWAAYAAQLRKTGLSAVEVADVWLELVDNDPSVLSKNERLFMAPDVLTVMQRFLTRKAADEYATLRQILYTPLPLVEDFKLGTYSPNATKVSPAFAHQPARLLQWAEFDAGLPTFAAELGSHLLDRKILKSKPNAYFSEGHMMHGSDVGHWPLFVRAAALLGLKVQVVEATDPQLRRKPSSPADCFWALVAPDGKLDVVATVKGTCHFSRPVLEGYQLLDMYDPDESTQSSNPGRTTLLIQQLVGEIRADAMSEPSLGGVGLVITDQVLWAVKFVEDDEAGDAARQVPCSGPAGQVEGAYRSGSAYFSRAYLMTGTPTPLGAQLYLAAIAAELQQKSLSQQAQAGMPGPTLPPPSMPRRPLNLLPFDGWLADGGHQRGKLQLEEILGIGASGIVHRAVLAGRDVAIKLPDVEGEEGEEGDDGQFEALQHELQMITSEQLKPLVGLAVVGYVGSGTCAGQPFVAYELMGPSAAAAALALSPQQEAAGLRGLAQLHAAGVLHGDVNPGNLLLPLDGVGPPKWADLADASFSQDPREHEAEMVACRRMLAELRPCV